jgi:uncharacterized coiled-coil DUF342 family protein
MEQEMSAKEIYQMELEDIQQKMVELSRRADEIRKRIDELTTDAPIEIFSMVRNWQRTL